MTDLASGPTFLIIRSNGWQPPITVCTRPEVYPAWSAVVVYDNEWNPWWQKCCQRWWSQRWWWAWGPDDIRPKYGSADALNAALLALHQAHNNIPNVAKLALVRYGWDAIGKSHREQHERTLMATPLPLSTQPLFFDLNYVQKNRAQGRYIYAHHYVHRNK